MRPQAEGDVIFHLHMRKQRVVLHHHRQPAFVRRQLGDVSIADQDPPASRLHKPAIARSTVVFPEPEGPISASTSPGSMVNDSGFKTTLPWYETRSESR